jgi:hypothetical protein
MVVRALTLDLHFDFVLRAIAHQRPARKIARCGFESTVNGGMNVYIAHDYFSPWIGHELVMRLGPRPELEGFSSPAYIATTIDSEIV